MIENIKKTLQRLISHAHIKLTSRGNTAIKAALSVLNEGENILIPEEGGWLTYKEIPKKLGLKVDEVKCNDAKIDIDDLKQKLDTKEYSALLYSNPGGYHAEQPIEDIYEICKEYGCLVILDVSGCIGTELCGGNFADIIVGSFGKWKPINAGKGGFVSCQDEYLFEKIDFGGFDDFSDQEILKRINDKLIGLQDRLKYLQQRRGKIIKDLNDYQIINKDDWGLVVIFAYSNNAQRENIINYCCKHQLEFTECPRYIRINKKAISIEVKRL